MDERIEKALKFSEYRATLNNQLAQVKHYSEAELVFAINGGSFHITPELISFAHTLTQHQEEAILLDKNDTPIKIENIKEFLESILERYNKVTEDMFVEVSRIRKARNVQSAVNVDLGD